MGPRRGEGGRSARHWDDERPTAAEIGADFADPDGADGFPVPSARGRGIMPRAARSLAQSLLDAGWEYVTVDPYEWNERALRGWANAGFAVVSRGHPPDEHHTSSWVLMRFEPSARLES